MNGWTEDVLAEHKMSSEAGALSQSQEHFWPQGF